MAIIDKLNVDLADRRYDIIVGSDIFSDKNLPLATMIGNRQAIIITDTNVAKSHLKTVSNYLKENNLKSETIILPDGEKTKSFTYLTKLMDKIFAFRPNRKTILIALGGGVIGDLVGFTASILLRGVDFIQIPTTLLSQVDSSVGGKTGINNDFGKNLIGTFYQPKLVLTDISMLKTLPHRQFVSGYAEIVKYALINNRDFFVWLESNIELLKKCDPQIVAQAIILSCKTKAQIVAMDEKESNIRALLNLGHTLGHAMETYKDYSEIIYHGEAVALGTIFAFELSKNFGSFKNDDIEMLKLHYKKIGLPISPFQLDNDWDIKHLMELMMQDKKVDNQKLTFILATQIGKTYIEKNVENNLVFNTLKKLFA